MSNVITGLNNNHSKTLISLTEPKTTGVTLKAWKTNFLNRKRHKTFFLFQKMSLIPHVRVLYTCKPLFLLKIEEEQLDCLENSEKLHRTEKPRKGVTYSAKNLIVLKKAKEGIVGLFFIQLLADKKSKLGRDLLERSRNLRKKVSMPKKHQNQSF